MSTVKGTESQRKQKCRSNRPEDVYVDYIGQCIALAGDVRAGVLLYCVWRRMRRSTFTRDGHRWLILTKAQWLRATQLTKSQYDDALAILKERRLIVVDYDKVGRSDRYQQTFIRLPDGFRLQTDSGDVDGSPSGIPDHDPPGHRRESPIMTGGSPSAPPDHTKYVGHSDYVGQKDSGRDATVVAAGDEVSSGRKTEAGGEATGGDCKIGAPPADADLDQETRALAPRLASDDPEHRLRALGAAVHLQPHQAWALAHLVRGEPCRPWTDREWGMARTLRKALGEYTVPTILLAVVHWEEFRQASIGAILGPTPLLGSLVGYSRSARFFANEKIRLLETEVERPQREAEEARRRAQDPTDEERLYRALDAAAWARESGAGYYEES